MTRNSLFRLFSIAAVLMLLVAACGDDDDDDADPTATSPSAGGAPTETRDTGNGGGEGTEAENGGGELVAMGEELYTSQGCNACHSVDGSESVGPTWQGLWMSEVTLESGDTVTADEEYIRTSIANPNDQVHEGFQPIMPAFGNLSDEQINSIIAYIESLA